MELQLTIVGASGKATLVVQTPQELWDALVAMTEPALGVIPVHQSVRVNRVITVAMGEK